MFQKGDSVGFAEEEYDEDTPRKREPTLLGKTFIWLFIALAITSGVAFALPYVLTALDQPDLYIGFVVGGAIVMFICSFVVHLSVFVDNKGIVSSIAMIIYSIAVGMVLSVIPLMFDTAVVTEAFAVTSLIFIILAVYGIFSKTNHIGLIVSLSCMAGGCLLLILINLLLRSEMIYTIISIASFIVMLGYVIIDANMAMNASKSGEKKTSTAIFFALNLYSDFIYIFLRILIIIASSKSNN